MLSGARRRTKACFAFAGWLGLAAPLLVGCGQKPGEDLANSETSIIGGSLDTTHRGVVSLLKELRNGYYPACSGTLLAQNLVLTAQHCVSELSSDDGSVECGKTTFGAHDAASTMIVSVEANVGQEGIDPFQVSDVRLPPGGNAACGEDIALLLLKGAGVPAKLATPIEPRVVNEVSAQDVFSAIGYGLTDPKDSTAATAGHRMGVGNAKVFCTGAGCGTDLVVGSEWMADSPVCSGDSGGPALDGSGRVAGVTSRGDQGCTVAIYSSVYAWRDFIEAAAVDAATRGGYPVPVWAGGTAAPSSGGSTGASGSGGSGTGGSATTEPAGGASGVGIGGKPSGAPPSSPTIDPLGLACTDSCPGAYACWTATNEPPGICVPRCGDGLAACPNDYACSAGLGVCTPSQAAEQPKATDSSCSISAPAPRADGSGALWLALGLLTALRAGASSRRKRAAGI
jgi:hypothetical protein